MKAGAEIQRPPHPRACARGEAAAADNRETQMALLQERAKIDKEAADLGWSRTVLENADFLRERQKELPLRVVQLDDGYQKAYGDWLEHSDRFPHGVEWLAGEIAARGLVPGIWVAPFTLHARSAMARLYPAAV